jgi:hypothetical protein
MEPLRTLLLGIDIAILFKIWLFNLVCPSFLKFLDPPLKAPYHHIFIFYMSSYLYLAICEPTSQPF